MGVGMSFHVGQKVVCVDDKPFNGGLDGLIAGNIYTIRGFGECMSGPLGIRLVELLRPKPANDMPYLARRFRPIIERKTDISIFTAMLTPNRVDA